VLLEQYPDRHVAGRASDVLFAATIAEALRRFDYFGAGHLLKVLSVDHETPQECSVGKTSDQRDAARPTQASRELPDSGAGRFLESRIAAANSVLGALKEWGNGGVLDPVYVSALALRVAQRVVDSDWAHDA